MKEGFKEKVRDHARRYIQLISAVLYNLNLKGFLSGRIYKGASKGLCVPGLNCYSCPGAVFSCPLGSFQNALAKSAYKIPLYMLGTLILFGILFGRLICGFLCPFGLFQELLYLIPVPKIKKSKLTGKLSYLKYIILLIFVIAIPMSSFVPGFCKYICPAGTLEAGIPLIIMDLSLQQQVGFMFYRKLIILIVCLVICAFCYRAFCRFFCPLGAIYSIFNPVAFFGIQRDMDKCNGCNACIRVCKMDSLKVGDRECIHCGECIRVCPEKAICYGAVKKQNDPE